MVHVYDGKLTANGDEKLDQSVGFFFDYPLCEISNVIVSRAGSLCQ